MTQVLKHVLICSLGAIFALPSAMGQQVLAVSDATSSGKSSAGVAASDTTFLKKALAGGIAEVEFGRLAVAKASSPGVKQFGQRMIDDHGKSNDQLTQVAATEHISLPQGLSPKDKATKSGLENLSGADFERAYMNEMVRDHKKDVSEFERQSKSAFDQAVRSFAAQTLPTLREHLKEALRVAPTQQASVKSTH
jgi:putative membrane protein